MKEVQVYKKIDKVVIDYINKTKNIYKIQGHAIVIVFDETFEKKDLVHFFDLVLNSISKIVLFKNYKYYLLCNKFDTEKIEPFKIEKDLSKKNKNDKDLIVKSILKYSL